MLATATSLRDSSAAGVEHALWAAVRTFAAVASLEQVAELIEFLRPEEVGTTRQVALQAIQHMLELEPAPGTREVKRLVERTKELALKYLDNDFLTSPEAVALATAAYCAAVLADAPGSDELTARLVSLSRKRMLKRSREVISNAKTARERRGFAVDSLISHLSVIGALPR